MRPAVRAAEARGEDPRPVRQPVQARVDSALDVFVRVWTRMAEAFCTFSIIPSSDSLGNGRVAGPRAVGSMGTRRMARLPSSAVALEADLVRRGGVLVPGAQVDVLALWAPRDVSARQLFPANLGVNLGASY